MNVSLTPELERLVADQVKTGLYASASDAIRDAIRRAFLPTAPAYLEGRLAGMANEPTVSMTSKDWKDNRKALQKRLDARKKAK